MSQDILFLKEDLEELQYFAETDNKSALIGKITEMQKENNKKVAELTDWSDHQSWVDLQKKLDDTVKLKKAVDDFGDWADKKVAEMKHIAGEY